MSETRPMLTDVLAPGYGRLHAGFLFTLVSFLFWSATFSGRVEADSGFTIEISKSAQELRLKRGNHIFRTFRIAYGKGANGPKRQRGDNRTPVGNYQIIEFKADSKFHYFMQINYPNPLDAWYGYRQGIISPSEYKQIAASLKNRKVPPQDTALGGYIGIHGMGEITSEKMKIHETVNWTEGCIALTNDEINYLRKYVTVGTPVLISN